MLAALIVVFREILEAGLVVGIVMAATRTVPRRGWWVGYGIVGGIAGACIVACFARAISDALAGFGQEWFNVAILVTATAMLTWHNVWMSRHGREIVAEMKAVSHEVTSGRRSLLALSIVVGIAVLREGSEVVLFLYGIAVSGHEPVGAMALGGLIGMGLSVAFGVVTYLGLLRIPGRHLFAATSGMLALLAAGMAAQAAAFLEQAQAVTALSQTVWNSSWLISGGSVAGKALHTLIGYTDRPTLLQLVVYVLTLAAIFTLMRLFGHAPDTKAKHS
jgi:high-affinity iron transporter